MPAFAAPCVKNFMSSAIDCDLLIVGASFTGLELLRRLSRAGVLSQIDSMVVDPRAQQAYIPLVHEQVCQPSEDFGDAEIDVASYVRSRARTRFVEDRVVALDVAGHEVELAGGSRIRARCIVLAIGSKVRAPATLLGSKNCIGVKFAEDRQRLRGALARLQDGARIVVVGGGISGVEMAGELAKWSASERRRGLELTLLHRGRALMPDLAPALSRACERELEGMGVDLRLQTALTEVGHRSVTLVEMVDERDTAAVEERSSMACELVIWAGGVVPAGLAGSLELEQTPAGWLSVDAHLRCRDLQGRVLSQIWAGGDAVRIVSDGRTWPTMQRAIECLWQAETLATNVARCLAAARRPGLEPGSGASSDLALATSLAQHRLRRDFVYGVSLGRSSFVAYGRVAQDFGRAGVWFRRWLMQRYRARYRVASR